MAMPPCRFTDIRYLAVASALWSLIVEKSGNSPLELRGCLCNILGAVCWQVSLHRRRRRSPSHHSLSQVPSAVTERAAECLLPGCASSDALCRIRALKSYLTHLGGYKGFSTDPSLTRL